MKAKAGLSCRRLILAFCGASALACGRERDVVQRDHRPDGPFELSRLCQGRHEAADLKRWFRDLHRLQVAGTVSLANLESVGCLRIGVSSRSAGKQVEAALPALGIPRDAVIIEITGPAHFFQLV
jgi:hypothetical protein